MGFFQGVAKAVGEISEENFALREKQKDRDLQIQRDEAGRKHEFALADHRAKLEERQATLLERLKSRQETEKKADAEAALMRSATSIFGKEAVLALQAADRLESVMDSYNERQLTPEDVQSIRFVSEQWLGSIPKEIQAGFLETLTLDGQEAAFDYLAENVADPMGSLSPVTTLSATDVRKESAKAVASLLGANYTTNSDGDVEYVVPQDYNQRDVIKLELDIAKRVRELQPTIGYEEAVSQAIEEISLEDYGIAPAKVTSPRDLNPVESTRLMGAESNQKFGMQMIDGVLDE